MGIYSTHDITRTDAREAAMRALMRDQLGNKQLEGVLEVIFSDATYFNFIVRDDDYRPDNYDHFVDAEVLLGSLERNR